MKVGIVGAGLGGLSAAIHLRLSGFDVSVFEAQSSVGGRANRISREGFQFDTGPSLLNYPWVFEDLFKSAGRRLEDYISLLPIDPSITFLWRDSERFSLSSRFDDLLREVNRLEPGSGPALVRFLRNASEQYRVAFDRLVTNNAENPLRWLGSLRMTELARLSLLRSFEGELARYFRNPRLRQAFGSYAMYLGGSPFELPGLFSILPFGELAYGLWLPKGGIYALVNAIRLLAEELGVEIHCSTPIHEIAISNGTANGLVTSDGRHLQFPVIVSNVDVPTTRTRLLGDHNQPSQPGRSPRMTPGVLTFYWGVRGNVEGLPHHSIFLPDDYRTAFSQLMKEGALPDDLPFYVSAPSKSDPSLAPSGSTLMFVLVPTPVLSQMGNVDWNNITAEVRQRVLQRLDHHGIRLNQSSLMVEEVWTPVEWQNRYGLYDGSAFGAAHTLMQMGPFRPRNYHPDIKGLYFVGASTTPGTGMPMVVLGGSMTAERIKSHVL
jgi:phytoene desaturase